MACVELKRKNAMIEKVRRDAAKKSTMKSYFLSLQHMASGQPLNLVLDSSMPNVLGAEEANADEYPNSDGIA